ncbi:MAG: ATP phosphoribosyltransferase regulatory subunit [Candidatus Pacebacteria bacterium]|nr:ATP phosphoribosyltransferase regulatory subunit [Candidatus Paceibacterota bacterium]
MGGKIQPIKGMHDILPDDLVKIEYVKSLLLRTAEKYGFLHVQTPTLESAEIYRSTSEFPEEKCYSLVDRKGRKMILRSDPDAQLVRLVANHFMYVPKPIKLAFCGSIFRSWNPHRREFKMFSISTFGVSESTADAEILRVIADVVEEVGFPGYRVEFNNLQLFRHIICATDTGSRSEDEIRDILYAVRFAPNAKAIVAALESYHLPKSIIDAILSLMNCNSDESDAQDVLAKLGRVFPLLIPEIEKTLAFKTSLANYGVQNLHLNVSNLHGTGFYSGFTYRLFPKDGSKEIGDGGRYDYMMQQMNCGTMPATGIGLGIERFIELMEANHCSVTFSPKAKNIVVAYTDSQLATRCRPVLRDVRSAGCIIEEDFVIRGFDKTVSYAKSKRCNRVIMVSAFEPEACIHLKVVNLNNGRTDSLVAHNLEELRDILLKCHRGL